MRHRAWLLICMGVATATGAQEVHRCVADGAIAYQAAPCGQGQGDAGVVTLPAYADPPERDGAGAPVAHPPADDDAPVAPSLPAPPVLQAGFPSRASIAAMTHPEPGTPRLQA